MDQFNEMRSEDNITRVTTGYDALWRPSYVTKSWDGSPATWSTYNCKYYIYNEVHAISEHAMTVLLLPWAEAQEKVAEKIGSRIARTQRRFPGTSATSAAFAQQPDNLPKESLQTAFKSLPSQKTRTQEKKQSSPSPAQAQMFDVSEEEIGENYEDRGGLFSESVGSSPTGQVKRPGTEKG